MSQKANKLLQLQALYTQLHVLMEQVDSLLLGTPYITNNDINNLRNWFGKRSDLIHAEIDKTLEELEHGKNNENT